MSKASPETGLAEARDAASEAPASRRAQPRVTIELDVFGPDDRRAVTIQQHGGNR